MESTPPKEQIKLFGYNKYFSTLHKMYTKNNLPNTILFNGSKGIGKATFAYHFINYIFSNQKDSFYDLDKYLINKNNKHYHLVKNNSHPNLFLLDIDDNEKTIKLEKIRSLLKFLSKSTLDKNIKIVLIDNVENLNINSSNALLKTLEEPSENTLFFIINNNRKNLLETIRSRCFLFNFHFTSSEKSQIFDKIKLDYEFSIKDESFNEFSYFETPGNFLNYLLLLKNYSENISDDFKSCILFLLEQYGKSKNDMHLVLISLLVEKYYNNLSIKKINSSNAYFFKKSKILNLINDMKKYNLDKRNLSILISKLL